LAVGWNVLDYLPKDDKAQIKSLLCAAWKLRPEQGMACIRKLAAWLDQKHPQAAASLLEGLGECFIINRLDLPPALHRCLATTNIIESPHAGVRIQTRRVTHWQNGKMVLRWMASAFLRTEKRFKRIMAIAICGPWKRSATRRRPPAKRRRSNINLTAAPHFQLAAGHARRRASRQG
jgi:transposase-like protein